MMESETMKGASEAVVNPISDFCSRLVLQVLIVAVLAISSSYALYEDQIGKFDWRAEHVGKVRLASVEPRTSPSKILYVATEQNVVAALDLRNGIMLWRAVMEDPAVEAGAGVEAMVTSARSVAAVSSGGQRLRVWDARSGVLKWEQRLQEHPCPTAELALDRSGSKILALRCNTLTAFALSHGEQLWETDISLVTSTRQMSWDRLSVDTKSDDISIFGGEEATTVAVASLDSASGRLKATDTKPAPWFQAKKCELVVSALLCLEPEGGRTQVVRAEGTRLDLTDGPTLPGLHLRVWALDNGYFGLSVDGELRVYEAGRVEPVVTIAATPTDVRLLSVQGSGGKTTLILGVLSAGEKEQEISWHSLPSGNKLASSQWPLGPTKAAVETLIPTAVAKGGEVSGRAVLGCEDGVLTLPGAWTRHEALSRILSMEMLDLPLSEAQANIEKEFATDSPEGLLGQMRQRLGMQYEQLGRSLRGAAADILAVAHDSPLAPFIQSMGIPVHAGSLKRGRGERAGLERDAFNLDKMILLGTEAGKVYGLDSRDGAVQWELWPQGLSPLRTANGETELPVLVLRSTAHFPHPALAVLIGAHKVEVRPRGVEVPSAPPVYFMSVDAESGRLAGLQVVRGGGGYVGEPQWSARLPITSAQRIHKVVGKRFSERMHSPGRALGDRSVLYKYANPNLVAIMALSPDVPALGGGASSGGELSVFLVDAVTGEVLSAMEHGRAAAPLHLLHCENWIVYSFWNEKARRTEVATLELYEGKTQADPDHFSSFAPALQKPLILPQSYIFQQGITALGVTDTEKGMTNRHLLIAMPFGGILELPKGLLDPRRSLSLTPENREEGLIPYIPELPIATEHILNYNQTLMRVRVVETRPGGLESTTLLFARGLDVYFTRLTPSGTFDVLKDDFDHWVIAAVLTALAVATLVSKRVARHRDLQQSWK